MMENSSYCRLYRPENKAKAAVFVVHGMQEHKERYVPFAEYLKEQGIACLIYDLPGHGKNLENNELGWFGEKDGWKKLIQSAADAAIYLRKEYPGVPVICFGHSMGAMIARCFLQRFDMLADGVILSGAPNYQSACLLGERLCNMEIRRKGLHGHSKMLDQLATGGFSKAVKNPRTTLDWLSVNEDNVNAYILDPLCGVPFTAAGYRDLFALMKQMGKVKAYRCTCPALPLYLMSGEEDPCTGGKTGLQDTVTRLKKAGYTDITVKVYPGLRHETLNEKCSEAVMGDIVKWIFSGVSASK